MLASFLLVCWIQHNDKNHYKKTKFDRFKLPILTSALIGLISNYVCENNDNNSDLITQKIFTEIPNF